MSCSRCTCTHESHDEYWACPLYHGAMVCNICCLFDIEGAETPLNGWTVEQIKATCAECGKNKYEVEPFDG